MLTLWSRAEKFLIGVLGLAALALGTYQMVGRYMIPAISTMWIDELNVYLLAWAAFLGASQLALTDSHVRADLFVRLLPAPAQRVIEIADSILAAAFSALLLWYGAWVTYDAWSLGERSTTGFGFPLYIYFLALPVGAALLAGRYLCRCHTLIFAPDKVARIVASVRES